MNYSSGGGSLGRRVRVARRARPRAGALVLARRRHRPLGERRRPLAAPVLREFRRDTGEWRRKGTRREGLSRKVSPPGRDSQHTSGQAEPEEPHAHGARPARGTASSKTKFQSASGAAAPPSTDDMRILDAKRHLGCVFHLSTKDTGCLHYDWGLQEDLIKIIFRWCIASFDLIL